MTGSKQSCEETLIVQIMYADFEEKGGHQLQYPVLYLRYTEQGKLLQIGIRDQRNRDRRRHSTFPKDGRVRVVVEGTMKEIKDRRKAERRKGNMSPKLF